MLRKVLLIPLVLFFIFIVSGCSTQASKEQAKEPGSKATPVTLKAATAWAKPVAWNDGFWKFYDAVNKNPQANLKLDWVGGPEAIPPFELIEAVKNGVVDIANIAGAYYVPQLPEADAIKLSPFTPAEERKNGFYDFMNQLHQDKVNAFYLGRSTPGVPYHLYLNKEVSKPDLKGLSIRVTPVYQALVSALGGAPVTISPGEVYTALERGVVQGYGWPAIGIGDFGWDEVTKYVVDPGFYQVDVVILVNRDKWNKLSAEQRKALTETMLAVEQEAAPHYKERIVKDRELISKKGVKVIQFSPEDTKKYVDSAYSAAWEQLLKAAPENGPKIKELLTK